jgi:hypothetical protein
MRKKISFSLALCLSVIAFGQEGPPPQGNEGGHGRSGGRGAMFRDMTRVMGTIVSISGDQIVLKPESGDNVTVKVSSETRVRKDRQDAKLSDFKVGDKIMAAGTQGSDKVLTARMVAGGDMGMMGQPPSPEELVKMGLGTTFIVGEVKAIEETKVTIARPDGQSQTIEVDENTSFKNGKDESVTLADVKIGDRVMGRGELKNGVFVPTTLRVGMPQGGPGFFVRRGTGEPGATHPETSQQQPK